MSHMSQEARLSPMSRVNEEDLISNPTTYNRAYMADQSEEGMGQKDSRGYTVMMSEKSLGFAKQISHMHGSTIHSNG